jgi:hypothetical protein
MHVNMLGFTPPNSSVRTHDPPVAGSSPARLTEMGVELHARAWSSFERALLSRIGCVALWRQGQLNGMRQVPEKARESDGLAGPEPGGIARFRRHVDQDLCPSQHRGGLEDVDHPPVVVTPGLPRGARGVPAEDMIQSGPHALGLLVTELHVAERDDHSVAGHSSMLRVRGKGVDPRVALGTVEADFQMPRENLIAFV